MDLIYDVIDEIISWMENEVFFVENQRFFLKCSSMKCYLVSSKFSSKVSIKKINGKSSKFQINQIQSDAHSRFQFHFF
jgi:hypothetical protein